MADSELKISEIFANTSKEIDELFKEHIAKTEVILRRIIELSLMEEDEDEADKCDLPTIEIPEDVSMEQVVFDEMPRTEKAIEAEKISAGNVFDEIPKGEEPVEEVEKVDAIKVFDKMLSRNTYCIDNDAKCSPQTLNPTPPPPTISVVIQIPSPLPKPHSSQKLISGLNTSNTHATLPLLISQGLASQQFESATTHPIPQYLTLYKPPLDIPLANSYTYHYPFQQQAKRLIPSYQTFFNHVLYHHHSQIIIQPIPLPIPPPPPPLYNHILPHSTRSYGSSRDHKWDQSGARSSTHQLQIHNYFEAVDVEFTICTHNLKNVAISLVHIFGAFLIETWLRARDVLRNVDDNVVHYLIEVRYIEKTQTKKGGHLEESFMIVDLIIYSEIDSVGLFISMLGGSSESNKLLKTDSVMRQSLVFALPFPEKINTWYTDRERLVEYLLWQNHSISLVYFANPKGGYAFQPFSEVITYYLCPLFYSEGHNSKMKLVKGPFKWVVGSLLNVKITKIMFHWEVTAISGMYNELNSAFEQSDIPRGNVSILNLDSPFHVLPFPLDLKFFMHSVWFVSWCQFEVVDCLKGVPSLEKIVEALSVAIPTIYIGDTIGANQYRYKTILPRAF